MKELIVYKAQSKFTSTEVMNYDRCLCSRVKQYGVCHGLLLERRLLQLLPILVKIERLEVFSEDFRNSMKSTAFTSFESPTSSLDNTIEDKHALSRISNYNS